MKFDIFLSICQTEVGGVIPDERTMFANFFDQVQLADELKFHTAWVAETHLSTEIQKQNRHPVVPHFKGEIGLNTDILQMAHRIFATTKNLYVGSAIRNILCNGGPIAHAEAIKTFLAIHGHNPEEKRILNIGFASGRFEFSNRPYGIVPRNKVEEAAWPVVKNKTLAQATEIFLRLLNDEEISSEDVSTATLRESDFRTTEDWQKTLDAYGSKVQEIPLAPRWQFEKIAVIPRHSRTDLLKLTIGTHDPSIQALANRYRPVDVFNLSITPYEVIEKTHQRMQASYHPDGGEWKRENMPRTILAFLSDVSGKSQAENDELARAQAVKAQENYFRALAGTIDPEKIAKAVDNSLVGSPETVLKQAKERFHRDDRIMLWFDFNNHNNEAVKANMRTFMQKVAPAL